jgi:uracil-DNA glycosylase family 4
MKKILFFDWKFSNQPINFFNIQPIENLPPISHNESYNIKSTLLEPIIQEDNHSLDNPLLDLNKLDEDINWISNEEQLLQIVNKYHKNIISDSINYISIGNGPNNNIMVIGDRPGTDNINFNNFNWLDYHYQKQSSFTGDEKILLKKMLNYIEVNPEDCYITTFSYWCPKTDRSFNKKETDLLRKFILKQIEIVRPTKILILGNTSAHGLLNTNKPLNNLRGNIFYINEIPCVVSFNPGFIKRFPNFASEAKKDMTLFKNINDN